MGLEQVINGKSTRREFCKNLVSALVVGGVTLFPLNNVYGVLWQSKKFKPANEDEEFFKWYIVDYVYSIVEKIELDPLFKHNLADKDNFEYRFEREKLDYDGWVKKWEYIINHVNTHTITISEFKVKWLEEDVAKVSFRVYAQGKGKWGDFPYRGYWDEVCIFKKTSDHDTEKLNYFYGDDGKYPKKIKSRWLINRIERTSFRDL